MINLAGIGRIFFGISIAEMGLQALFYANFPYMMLPQGNVHVPDVVAYGLGIILAMAGASIIFIKKSAPVSLVLGFIFLIVACFFLVPYEFIADTNRVHLGAWENAEKTLALAGGAFTIAGFSGKAGRLGPIIFGLMIIGFSVLHFVYAKDASGYIPSWIPGKLSWMYFCGAALLASGIAIILKIKAGLAAALLGAMIFTWFIVLHIPKVINAAPDGLADEISSAFLALAYCGTAFFVAGTAKRATRVH